MTYLDYPRIKVRRIKLPVLKLAMWNVIYWHPLHEWLISPHPTHAEAITHAGRIAKESP